VTEAAQQPAVVQVTSETASSLDALAVPESWPFRASTVTAVPLRWQGIYRSNSPLDENLPFLARLNLRTVLFLSPEVCTSPATRMHQCHSALLPGLQRSPGPDMSCPRCGRFCSAAWSTSSRSRTSSAPPPGQHPLIYVISAHCPELALRTVASRAPAPTCAPGGRLHNLGLQAWRPEPNWTPICDEFVKEALEMILDRRAHPLLVCCSSGILQTCPLVGCLRRIQHWSLTSILDEFRAFAGSKGRLAHEQFIEFFDIDLVTLPEQEHLPTWFVDRNLEDPGEARTEAARLAALLHALLAKVPPPSPLAPSPARCPRGGFLRARVLAPRSARRGGGSRRRIGLRRRRRRCARRASSCGASRGSTPRCCARPRW